MPMQVVDRPHVIVTRAERGPDPDVAAMVGAAASIAMWATAGVVVLGNTIDLGILWTMQRQSSAQWVFSALLQTAQALPLFVMGLSFVAGALFVRRTGSLLGYRLIALATLLLGLLGAVVAGVIVTEYLALDPELTSVPGSGLRAVALKGTALGVLDLAVLAPLGVLGLRWPRAL